MVTHHGYRGNTLTSELVCCAMKPILLWPTDDIPSAQIGVVPLKHASFSVVTCGNERPGGPEAGGGCGHMWSDKPGPQAAAQEGQGAGATTWCELSGGDC